MTVKPSRAETDTADTTNSEPEVNYADGGRRAANVFDGVLGENQSVRQAVFAPHSEEQKQALEKRLLPSNEGSSHKLTSIAGVCHHPFQFAKALGLHDISAHHSRCIRTLAYMTVGLGLKTEGSYDFLDPLTEDGFDDLMTKVALDLFDLGNGYMEVVRDPVSREVTGLHHIPARHMFKVVDGRFSGEYHYIYTPLGYHLDLAGTTFDYDTGGIQSQAVFARYGDADRLANAVGTERFLTPDIVTARFARLGIEQPVPHIDFGEVIVFEQPTNRWEHYGSPAWLGAQPYLDLNCKHLQRATDYMYNRGTPDHLVVFQGATLGDSDMKSLMGCLNAGAGRDFGRSAAISLPGDAARTNVQVERFSDGVDGLGFRELHDAAALAMCSAHGVPPILAGISVPRPMGSANELVQAMVLTQFTVVEPVQRIIQTTLRCTLGQRGSGIGRANKDTFKFRSMVKDTDIQALDTLARQRDTNTLSRDPKQGLKRDDQSAS